MKNILLIITLFQTGLLFAGSCEWVPVKIYEEREAHFEGSFEEYTVRWAEINDPATQFTITNNKKTECKAESSLFMDAKYAFYSKANNLFAVSEQAASSEELVFYDVNTCDKLASADISTVEEVSSKQIIDKGYCKCRDNCEGVTALCFPATVYSLDEKCLPHEEKELSKEYTRNTYGVEFEGYTLIESAKTRNAKIIENQ